MTNSAGRSTVRLWIGIGVLAVGVLELFDATGAYDADRLLRWWPVLLVGIGLLLLARGLASGRWFPGALLLLVGGSLLADRVGWLEGGLDRLWPLILVLLGLAIISRGLRRSRGGQKTTEARVSSFAVLSSLEPKVSSDEFAGGEISAVLGSCSLDLTAAHLSDQGAVLDLFALMGGIEIRVPSDWRVDSRVVPLMASVEDSTEPTTDRVAGRLELRGLVVMGGVEVKS